MLEFFKDDLSSPSFAKADLEFWRSHFSGKDLPDILQAVFKLAVLIPNVQMILTNIMVLLVTSYEVE